MAHNPNKPRMPAGFPGSLQPLQQQSSAGLFSPTGYPGSLTSLPSQSSTETMSSEPNKSSMSEINIARHCRIGQETVHEIINKSTEMFHVLKGLQLPNHLPTNHQTYNDRKKHLQEYMKTVLDYFKQLKHVYASVQTSCQRMDLKPVKDLIPLVDDAASELERSSAEGSTSMDIDTKSDAYRQIAAEHLALTEQLKAKNIQLKEVIDQLRNILWEINAMMSLKNTTP